MRITGKAVKGEISGARLDGTTIQKCSTGVER
jgi:hypothetical protein